MIPDFCAETHTYSVQGIRRVSVTQALREWVLVNVYGQEYFVHTYTGDAVPAATFRAAGEIGTATHVGCHYLGTGQGLDWESLDPVLVPMLRGFERWMADYRVEVIASEQPLYSERYDFAGTLDIICKIYKRKYLMTLVDIKTGGYGMAGAQTSAYECLWREHTKYKGFLERWVLHLPRDGGPYQFIPLRRADDWHFFFWKLQEYKWLQGRLT